MASVTARNLLRIERKLDLILQVQGLTLREVQSLADDDTDEAAALALIEKLRASSTPLAAAVAANQPK